MGVNFLEVHCGLDDQSLYLCSSTMDSLNALKKSVSIPLSAAGGINENTIAEVKSSGAEVAAVGAAIYAAKSPGEAARRIREKITT